MSDRELAEARSHVAHLRNMRGGREGEWKELADWVAPHRGVFRGEDAAPRHQKRNKGAFTQTASQAVLRGASGMTSGMTPKNSPWFKPCFTEEEMGEAPGARAWLDVLDTRLKDALANGGFYQAIHSFNMDLLWAGCALLYCEKGDSGPLRCECAQIGTFSLSLDEVGLVEACERTFMMSAASLEKKFGRKALSERTRRLLEKNPWQPVRVTHLARRAGVGKRKTRGMEIESLFWEDEGAEGFLKKGGFYEMPYFFTRWHEGPSPYGTGPGDDALMDSKQVDLLERRKLEGLGKLINPPVMAPAHYKSRVNLGPGGLNYVANMDQIRPIMDLSPYAGAMRWLMEELRAVEKRIDDELLASIFASMPLEQRPRDMSATEFLERKREALQQIGPVISAYEPNVLTPLLWRCLGILDREGLTPPPPESLAGLPLLMKVDFISPMANALRQSGAEAARAIVQDVGMMLKFTQQMDVLDKVDLDQVVDELASGLGAPGKIIRADADVAKIREARAQEMARRQRQEEAAKMMEMAGKAHEIEMGERDMSLREGGEA